MKLITLAARFDHEHAIVVVEDQPVGVADGEAQSQSFVS